MSNQQNQNSDSLYDPADEPMLERYQEGEDTQPEYVDTEEHDQEFCSDPKEFGSDEGEESEDDLDSKQKNRERANRSRVSSFSSTESQSSVGASSAFGSLRALDKEARLRSPYAGRDSFGNKRDRSSNSSADDSIRKVVKQKKPLSNKAVEFISAVGNQDKRVPTPPVKSTPTAPPKSVKPKTQFVAPPAPFGNRWQDMASRHVSNQSNTDDFSVVEQNSESQYK